jgi:GT2 family glycosyltransferase/glycosyltransferase involved in cell wall biosynthesis
MSVIVCSSVAEAHETLRDGTSAVVVVPIHDAYEDVMQCLEALVRHSPAETDLLLIDDASTDSRIATLPERLGLVRPRIVLFRHAENRGFVRTVNDGFAAAGRRDVIVINSDVIVGPEWFSRLRDAAYSDSRIATATPLTNNGTIVSVPQRNVPAELPARFTTDGAATAVSAGSSKLRPRLPTCVGHCMYIKRMALDLVGAFDEGFSPGYGEEVDFSQRCTLFGLAHVCADDVFVYHRGGGSFGQSPEVRELRRRHEDFIARRYPFYHPWVGCAANGRGAVLGTAIAEARCALLGMTVVVDGSALGQSLMGTQRGVLETIRALARHPRIGKVIAVMPTPHPDYVRDALRGCPKLTMVALEEARGSLGADVVYRPFQIFSLEELERLRRWGEHLVVAQLDLILFNNPGYYSSWYGWARYRDLTRLALAVADGVAFLSGHAEAESREAGLIAPGKPTKVVYHGTDHASAEPMLPEGLPPEVARRGFVLCLGTDYCHKNRGFALRVFAEMVGRGYDGFLVHAGFRVPEGSSRPMEAEYLLGHPGLASRVVSLGHIPEEARVWLYRHANLVLHPSLYEGFGLVPFEAALAGAPCLSSAQSALAELLPDDAEFIVEWEPGVVAEQAIAIIGDEGRRARLIGALARRASEFTWDRTAGLLVDLFDVVCRAVRGPEIEAVIGEVGVVAMDCHRPGGARPLMDLLEDAYPPQVHEVMRAIAQRRVLKRPFVAATVFAYRLASAMRSVILRRSRLQEPSKTV